MKRFFFTCALLTAVAAGCGEDPQARYAEEEQGDVSGEATPPMDVMMDDDAALENYGKEQEKLAD